MNLTMKRVKLFLRRLPRYIWLAFVILSFEVGIDGLSSFTDVFGDITIRVVPILRDVFILVLGYTFVTRCLGNALSCLGFVLG